MTKEPVKLIHEITDSTGNERIFMQLDNGRKLPLPYHFRPEEFILPGNVYQHLGGKIFALYDETTRTGLIYDGTCSATEHPYWSICQPALREDFFNRLVPDRVTMIGLMATGSSKQP